MISTRSLLASSTSPNNHLSTLLSLSSSSSSLSSSSSSSNTTNPTNAINNLNQLDLACLAMQSPNDYGLSSMINVFLANNMTQDMNNNNVFSQFDANSDNTLAATPVFHQLNHQLSEPNANHLAANNNSTNDLLNEITQRRNSSFQSPTSQLEEEDDLINENFNLIRKRFNSAGSNADCWPNLSLLQPSLIDAYRRHTSFNLANERPRDQRALSFNYTDLNNNNNYNNVNSYYFDNNNTSSNTMEHLVNRNLGNMTNPVTNSHSTTNTNTTSLINSNLPIFNLNKHINNSNKLSATNCLNPNCNLLNENLELVKFACNSCNSINFMHTLCYRKMQQAKRNSFSNGQYLPDSFSSTELNYNCNNCLIGVLAIATNNQTSNANTSFKLNSSTSTPYLNEHIHMNFNETPKFGPKLNGKLSKQHSSPVAANGSLRKKSLCLNNPPLPTPMQSVRESRSPSPINYTSTNSLNTPGNASNYFNNYKMTKRQSAPVNISLANKNRFRTMSTGSTGSFSASSSFSSSVGTAVSPTIQNANAYKKILSQSTHNNHALNKSDSSDQSSQSSTSAANTTNNKSSSPNLSTSMNESLGEKLASSGNMFYSRDDWSILKHVPFNKQNAIHIRLEDEGPYGNDETRCFLLSHFSTLGIREIACVLCGCQLNIYDRFPLIDGTFYLSPVNYESANPSDTVYSVPANISNKNQFIYSICLGCLHSNNNQIKCKSCNQEWKGGASLQIGTMYRYEIFAAFPCCQKRFNCSKCDSPIVNYNKSGGLQYFSSYSDEVTCQVCKHKDFHFVKPLSKFYDIISNQKQL